MATLLWPATGGYTIPYMLGYTLDSETFDGLRQFATTVLRAREPIPPFQVGTVAYGVLPVMSIVNPLPLSGIAYGQVPARVASLVQSARGLWLDSLYDPTAANSDPNEAILRVLSTDAGTCNLSAGYSMGPEQMSNFVQYVGIDQRPQWQQFYDEVVTQTAQQLDQTPFAHRGRHRPRSERFCKRQLRPVFRSRPTGILRISRVSQRRRCLSSCRAARAPVRAFWIYWLGARFYSSTPRWPLRSSAPRFRSPST